MILIFNIFINVYSILNICGKSNVFNSNFLFDIYLMAVKFKKTLSLHVFFHLTNIKLRTFYSYTKKNPLSTYCQI